ncbi:sigma-70 family RNA polymerase sigma factor [Streptacidiphilus sp. EB129]|uniref:sigma-70 family RNA polymerase sigma factor n=1 Tax=Streptacidiphilus sp. EB129 TaxID=3156262 RepID=UPI003515E264
MLGDSQDEPGQGERQAETDRAPSDASGADPTGADGPRADAPGAVGSGSVGSGSVAPESGAVGTGLPGSGSAEASAAQAQVPPQVPPQGARHRAARPVAATVPAPGGPPDEDGLPPSDALLTAAVRAGDDSAFEELYRRHADSVRRYARTCCRDAFTAEDLAGEVFARTLQALRAGKGPDIAVRAYLLTAVRNIAATWARSDRREQLVDDFTLFAATSAAVADVSVTDPGADAWAMAELDHSLVLRAFSRLEPDDRMVLWHTEVEQEPPREVAVLIGKTANATAVQAHRARDRLATEFLQAHVSDTQETACAEYARKLGAFARGGLGKRASTDVRAHMNDCDRCSAAYLELVDLNHSLRELLPVGALVWVGTGYFATLAAAAGIGAGAAVGGAAASGSAGGGSGGGAGAAASEGLGVPAKAGIAAVVTVAVVAGVVFALSGSDHPVPPPKPRAVKVVPKPVAPVPAPKPPAAAPTPAPPPPRPAVVVKPAPRPLPPKPSPRPRPTPVPTPKPPVVPPPPPPPPVADYFVDALPFSGVGTATGPTVQGDASSWLWQRSSGVRIGGQSYGRGVTVHAPSAVTVDLNRGCTSFDAVAGIDDLTMGLGAVRFAVVDDGTGATLWQSGVVNGGDTAVPVQVPLTGVARIRLVVSRADQRFLVGDVADWAQARFVCH